MPHAEQHLQLELQPELTHTSILQDLDGQPQALQASGKGRPMLVGSVS